MVRLSPTLRFATGSVAGLASLAAVIYVWEFASNGAALQLPYYFSYFAIPVALTIASIAALLVSLARAQSATRLLAVGAATAAVVVPLVLIYRSERASWGAETGVRISLAMMAISGVVLVGALLARRTRAGALATVVAIGAVGAASHYAVASSSQIFLYSASNPNNRSLYHAALDHVDFVKEATAEDEGLPTFWYRGTQSKFASIQSMYYFAYTALGWELPNVTSDLRERLDLMKPRTIVLLCDRRDCGGAAKRLRAAGYPFAEFHVQRIARGGVQFWTVILRRLPDA
jgi:hypothetical protein